MWCFGIHFSKNSKRNWILCAGLSLPRGCFVFLSIFQQLILWVSGLRFSIKKDINQERKQKRIFD
uniref:Uncharacterized protein n=1 Tax=Utricularia reniformis TaxID=192314 RepID=A0A1Y0AZE2_9LAMI|nr:hypothetical protein AEK19_MT0268 [Utricularia reniformis]ART30545.1 hypothetical protein AEK19_MT0268 [Utricularia reniformis]